MNININAASAGPGPSALEKAVTKKRELVEESNTPVDLTADALIALDDKKLNKLNEAVARIRVVVEDENGKQRTLGGGSGSIISPDGLLLSVNHVPALGTQKDGGAFNFVSGTQALKNLTTWNDLLAQKGKAKLVADIIIAPDGPALPETLFTPKVTPPIPGLFDLFSQGRSEEATKFPPFTDGTVRTVTVPLEIISESPDEDLMLAKINLDELKEPLSSVTVASDGVEKGQKVFSLGHPKGIVHNALARGEVLDPSFDVKKIQEAVKSHAHVFQSVLSALPIKIPGITGLKHGLNHLARDLKGIDVSVLSDFLDGAVISTNNIDHGSSGGFLGDKDAKLQGVTYLGVPKKAAFLTRYLTGALDLNPVSGEAVKNLTGSVGLDKVHRFLENAGIDMNKLLDGEAVGASHLADSATRNKARQNLTTVLLAQGKSETDIEHILGALDLKETKKPEKQEKPEILATVLGEGLEAKLKSVESVKFSKDDKSIAVELTVRLADGEAKTLNTKINPYSFNVSDLFDDDSRKIVESYLKDTEAGRASIRELAEIQAGFNTEATG